MAIIKTVDRLQAVDSSNRLPTGLPSAIQDNRMGFLGDLWGFMRARKKYWLLPLLIILLLFGSVIVFASGSAIAPFIYTLF